MAPRGPLPPRPDPAPSNPPPCPAALGSLPGAPLLVVPRGFTPCVRFLPGATRGDIAVLIGTSWRQGHIPSWGHHGASSRPHAGLGRAAVKGDRSYCGRKAGIQVVCLPQVVRMARRALLEEPEAAASPLLCLSQSGPPGFLQPVTVQLPLPPGVTGDRQPCGIPGHVATGGGG